MCEKKKKKGERGKQILKCFIFWSQNWTLFKELIQKIILDKSFLFCFVFVKGGGNASLQNFQSQGCRPVQTYCYRNLTDL